MYTLHHVFIVYEMADATTFSHVGYEQQTNETCNVYLVVFWQNM